MSTETEIYIKAFKLANRKPVMVQPSERKGYWLVESDPSSPPTKLSTKQLLDAANRLLERVTA